MHLTYHPEAELEIIEQSAYYEQRVVGLGERLLTELDRVILEILETPHRWPIVEDDLRRRVMSGFPFGIYYRVVGDEVRILVFKHHARHPDYWRARLEP